jgi:hypothetical protein
MTATINPPTERAWLSARRLDAELLATPVKVLRLPRRVHRACAELHLHTVADILGADPVEFTALHGIGARSWERLTAAARRALLPLSRGGDALSGTDVLRAHVSDPRAVRALERLGDPSTALLARASREAMLALPGFDDATWRRLTDSLAANIDAALFTPIPLPASPSVWPDTFTARRVDHLELASGLSDALRKSGLVTFGDLLDADASTLLANPDIGATGLAALRVALDHALPEGSPHERHHRRNDGGLGRLLAVADERSRDYLVSRLGLDGRPPVPATRLARAFGLPSEGVPEFERQLRNLLLQRRRPLVRRWRRAAMTELRAQNGTARHELLARGVLRTLGRACREPVAPFRLLAFFFPTRLHVVGDALTTVSEETCKRVLTEVQRLIAKLPLPLPSFEAELRAAGAPPIPRGLLHHLLQHDANVQILIDHDLGEVLHRRRTTVGDRIEQVLRSARTNLALPDLLFRYRDRYGRARRARLLDYLWTESRFVEIGPGQWDLRERHVDQIELVEAEAARVRDILLTVGGRHDIDSLVEGGETTQRVLFLLRDCLRRDPALRTLGHGSFCPRQMRTSEQIAALVKALNQAMGELPLDRFLANQARQARHLRTRLLRENRLFVEIGVDRIDLLSNYPFNSDRLRELTRTVELHLEQRDGFDRIDSVLRAVQEVGIGGEFLTAHMLRDLLRRHGRFELLSEDLVAQRARGLKAWIQQRARDAIRRAVRGLTPVEIVAELPELADFAVCLEKVIGEDPMVQSPDGQRYVVV